MLGAGAVSGQGYLQRSSVAEAVEYLWFSESRWVKVCSVQEYEIRYDPDCKDRKSLMIKHKATRQLVAVVKPSPEALIPVQVHGSCPQSVL